MAKNRVSFHRGSGNAKHNEHEKIAEEERNVEVHRCIHLDASEAMDLTQYEMKFYERYKPVLQKQNEKYIKKRNYKRVKNLEDFYNTKRYAPRETILQYGHFGGEVPDKENFEKMTAEYISRLNEWSEANGGYLHVLDWSNHYDESTPHCHFREVWDYTDENGDLKLGQAEALKRAGVPLPDPTKPESTHNNRTQTYTQMCRKMWQDVCEEFGFEVERVPLYNGRKKGETVAEFNARMARENEAKAKELEAKEQENKKAEDAIRSAVSKVTGKEYFGYHNPDYVVEELLEFCDKQNEKQEQIEANFKECERILNETKKISAEAKANFAQSQSEIARKGDVDATLNIVHANKELMKLNEIAKQRDQQLNTKGSPSMDTTLTR